MGFWFGFDIGGGSYEQKYKRHRKEGQCPNEKYCCEEEMIPYGQYNEKLLCEYCGSIYEYKSKEYPLVGMTFMKWQKIGEIKNPPKKNQKKIVYRTGYIQSFHIPGIRDFL